MICRWLATTDDGELVLDAMPGSAELLGVENRWQRAGLAAALAVVLPSGRRIRRSRLSMLATKLEAWLERGAGDHLRSQDLEDVVSLVDSGGRALWEE